MASDTISFNSYISRKFSRDWDFNYVFVSPHFPQSNDMVARGVGIVKSIKRKAGEDNKDYFVEFIEYRNTPISGIITLKKSLLKL